MGLTRAQFDQFCGDKYACYYATVWMKEKSELEPRCLWRLCEEPWWMWWLCDKAESAAGIPYPTGALQRKIKAIYAEFSYTFIKRKQEAADCIRSAVQWSEVEALILKAIEHKETTVGSS